MLLSEIFGVERDTDFMIKGYSLIFQINLYTDGANKTYERLISVDEKGCVYSLSPGMVYYAISIAPSGIIPLPRPLTDNQIEHLKALWAIGGQWLAKDASGAIFCYKAKPQKKDGCEWTTWESDEFIDITDFVTSVSGLVSWLDHEPYDIAKALGIKR